MEMLEYKSQEIEKPIVKEVKFKISNAQDFKNILKALNVVGDEINFEFSSDALKVRMMDPSHVMMVNHVAHKSGFDEWLVSGKEIVCLNVGELLKTVFSRIGKEDALKATVEYLNDKTSKIVLNVRGKTQRQTKVMILQGIVEDVPEPKITLTSMARVAIDEFLNCLKDAQKYSDEVTFTCTNEALTLSASGDLGEFTAPFQKNDESVLVIECKQVVKATFSLNQIVDIVQGLKNVCDVITVDLGTDMPIKLGAELRHEAKIDFYLAPRING